MIKMKEKPAETEHEIAVKHSKLEQITGFMNSGRKLAVTVLAAILIVLIALNIIFTKKGSLTTEAETSLKQIIDTGDISTVQYTYNSIVTIYDEKNKPKYHVAYDGTAKAGFDFNKIDVSKDNESKKIIVTVPQMKVTAVNVDSKTMDYIFEKKKYDTETTYQEAYKACISDLEKKAKSNKSIKKMAFENAVDSMKAILIPLESRLPDGYTFDFREEGSAR